jgi:predicted RNase H-like nuclease/ADP-ribose pyrophosphatase YjhB (NUDIX family)
VAPSYPAFLALAGGAPVDWRAAPRAGAPPEARALLAAARQCAGAAVDVVAVDMPVALLPIRRRRAADDAASRAFGSRWCATHSPSALRPGALGARLTADFAARGYPLVTAAPPARPRRGLLEVYPHAALLALLRRWRRLPYKVGRARQAWPDRTPSERAAAVLREMRQIRAALVEGLGPLALPLPASPFTRHFVTLKRYEDALDALVCAWVGMRYAEGTAAALGDSTAAIWFPAEVVLSPAAQPVFGAAPPGVRCRPRRAAYAVIRDDVGRVATVRPAGAGRPVHWLPGGGALPGETPARTVLREIREELGREARLDAIIGEAVQVFHAREDRCWYEMKSTFFSATLFGRAPRPRAREHVLEWRTPDACSFFHPCHAWAARRRTRVHA